jgi:hypothetical protein
MIKDIIIVAVFVVSSIVYSHSAGSKYTFVIVGLLFPEFNLTISFFIV